MNTHSLGGIDKRYFGCHTGSVDGRDDDLNTRKDFLQFFLGAREVGSDNVDPFLGQLKDLGFLKRRRPREGCHFLD